MLKSMTIGQRLWFLVLVGLFALTLISLFSAFAQRDNTMTERRHKTLALIDSAQAVIQHFGDAAQSGKLELAAAQAMAKEAIGAMRYEGDNYFFIVNGNHQMLRHPMKPELEGKDLSGLKDANGVGIVVDAVRAAKRGKQEFTDYVWPRGSGSQPVPKVSGSAYYAPWDWVVVTGIYVDDVDTAFHAALIRTAIIFAVAAVVLLGLAWRVVLSITEPIDQIQRVAQRIAEGDLSGEILVEGSAEIRALLSSFSQMQTALRNLVQALQGNAREISIMSEQLASTTQQLASSSEEQAQSASSMAASIEEMSVSISQVSDHASEVSASATRSSQASTEGSGKVKALIDADRNTSASVQGTAQRIRQLSELSVHISSIVAVIREIAEQTNLLALNAAIEAARAGEQGRGFAVVADEVRKLAERTADSTQEIAGMIERVQSVTSDAVASMEAVVTEISDVTHLSESTGESMKIIDEQSHGVQTVVNDITNALHEQSAASHDIARRVEKIAQMSEENSAAVRQTAAAARQLEAVAVELQKTAMHFKLG